MVIRPKWVKKGASGGRVDSKRKGGTSKKKKKNAWANCVNSQEFSPSVSSGAQSRPQLGKKEERGRRLKKGQGH